MRPRHLPLPPTPLFQTQESLRDGLKHLKLHMSSLLYKCVNAETPAMNLLEPPAATHADHDGSNICPRYSSFYEDFVNIDSGRLELLTQEQSASHLWHDSRKLRVTASSAKKGPVKSSPQVFLQQHAFPRFHGNATTRQGMEGEVLALKWLADSGYRVTRHGTVLCPGEPWLSASPDGVQGSC